MLKTIVLMLGILALAACAARPTERQSVAQTAPVQAEAKVSTEKDENQVVGQTIYVPIYSHITHPKLSPRP